MDTDVLGDVSADLNGGRRPFEILGRFGSGRREVYVLLEEPGKRVNMHWHPELRKKVVHLNLGCPHCEGCEDPKPFWFIGAVTRDGRRIGAVELSEKCFRSVEVAARSLPLGDDPVPEEGQFTGLVIEMARGTHERSERIVRALHRVEARSPWPYDTRRELARLWHIPIKPRIYKEA